MRQYCSERLLSWIFGISQSQVYQYTRSTLRVLHQTLINEVIFPHIRFRAKHGVTWRGKWITIVIDGTEQEVLVPSHGGFEKNNIINWLYPYRQNHICISFIFWWPNRHGAN